MKFGINNPAWLQSGSNVGIGNQFYLEALEDNSVLTFNHRSVTEYSIDGINYSNAPSTLRLNSGDRIYIKLTGEVIASGSDPDLKIATIDKRFAAGGEMPALTINYGEWGKYPYVDFSGSEIVDASKLVIRQADGAAQSCFKECTSLVYPPQLPTKILKENAYSGMFEGCTSLVEAPELPATYLARSSYSRMFYGCTGLVDLSNITINALKMEDGVSTASSPTGGVCEEMFYGCTNLKYPPKLQSNKVGSLCYYHMFEGCTSLVEAPELPAIEVEESSYSSMFYGCTSLMHIPELPATTVREEGYSGMFMGCTSLQEAPIIRALYLDRHALSNMFEDCVGLSYVPDLSVVTTNSDCFNSMFENCVNLINAPKITAEVLYFDSCNQMFKGCSSLSSVTCLSMPMPEDGFYEWLSGVSETGTFTKAAGVQWPTGVNGIPEGWTVQEYAGDNFEVGEL